MVDEAPAGPDQKAKVVAVLMPLLPQLIQAGLIGPQAIADVIPFLPIPAAVANKLAQAIMQQAQQQQAMAAQTAPQQQAMAEATLADKQADVGKKSADAQLSQAKAFKEVTTAHETHVGMLTGVMGAPPIQKLRPFGGPVQGGGPGQGAYQGKGSGEADPAAGAVEGGPEAGGGPGLPSLPGAPQ